MLKLLGSVPLRCLNIWRCQLGMHGVYRLCADLSSMSSHPKPLRVPLYGSTQSSLALLQVLCPLTGAAIGPSLGRRLGHSPELCFMPASHQHHAVVQHAPCIFLETVVISIRQ